MNAQINQLEARIKTMEQQILQLKRALSESEKAETHRLINSNFFK